MRKDADKKFVAEFEVFLREWKEETTQKKKYCPIFENRTHRKNKEECRTLHFRPNVPLKEKLFLLQAMFRFQGTYKLHFVSLSLRTSVQSAESFSSLGTTCSCYVDRTRELEVPEIFMSSVLFISLRFLWIIFRIPTVREDATICTSNI